MSKGIVNCGWDDVPHLREPFLSTQERADLESSYPPHQRKARTKGVPYLGAGAIYPIDEEDVLVDPFDMPGYWPRVFALDPGWNKTAALWAAIDRDNDTAYLYAEHYRGHAEPAVHASAIKARGEWIPGVADPAARGSNQKDGEKLLKIYRDHEHLNLVIANNAVEAGLDMTLQLLSFGKLKVFRTLRSWLSEYRIYRRDENGKVVKERDHLMDCMRYLVLKGFSIAEVRPVLKAPVSPWQPADQTVNY